MSMLPDYLDSIKNSSDAIACPLCGGESHAPIYEGLALRQNDLRCVVCKQCTHIFLNPRPSLDAFKRFYADDSYFQLCAQSCDVSLSAKMAQFQSAAYWEKRAAHGARLFEQHLTGILGPEDVVFDFGCGDGGWLEGLHRISGCEIAGEEISNVYADVVKERLGIDVFVGPIEELGGPIVERYAGRVKVAIVSGSLQHMLSPMECLSIIHAVLQSDGVLYVCNWNLFEHYMSPYQGRTVRRLLGEVLSLEHVHYFHEASMRYMLARAGFSIEHFALESSVRPRHSEALSRKSEVPSQVEPLADWRDVVARISALESATIMKRMQPIVGHDILENDEEP